MPRWIKGKSGNPHGRPKRGAAIADLARQQIAKHKLVEILGRIGGGQGEYAGVEVDQQLRAIQLLLSYGYGPPRAEVDGNDGKMVIQVIYAERNQIAINAATPSPTASDTGSETLQRRLLRAPLREDSAGNEPAGRSGTTG
jgi:hypothetical protein